jgi:hypothetical protein
MLFHFILERLAMSALVLFKRGVRMGWGPVAILCPVNRVGRGAKRYGVLTTVEEGEAAEGKEREQSGGGQVPAKFHRLDGSATGAFSGADGTRFPARCAAKVNLECCFDRGLRDLWRGKPLVTGHVSLPH